MQPRSSRWPVLRTTAVLMCTLASLIGCVQVEVSDSTPSVSTTLANAASTGDLVHDLGIRAVDLNPALDHQQLVIPDQPVAVLVIIENTGDAVERSVTVRAELSTVEDSDMSLSQGASIGSIAPGETQVARFGRLGAIPYHQTYHLEVILEPVPGENDLADNRRAFDIEIHRAQENP